MNSSVYPVSGSGLGLRRDFLDDAITMSSDSPVNFWEVAPENWMNIGGAFGKKFRQLTERDTFVCHGLSLSIGSTDPLDVDFVKALKAFFKEHNIVYYSEHLSYCSDSGHMYDLMPIPFTEEAVRHVADRIKQVQDILEQRIAMENVSYYAAPGQEMDEIDFLKAVLEEADCDFHLDINNIYVNSINHHYDAEDYLSRIPAQRIGYAHIAGHYAEAEDLRVDTHGADVIDPVWELLESAYRQHGVFPTLLERDFNIPAFDTLLKEVGTIAAYQQKHTHQTTGMIGA